MGRSDVLIAGGGLVGLAIALELHQQGVQVTLLTKDTAEAAGNAAAGMLAPHAEQISPGPMQALCLRSLALYPNWIGKLESLTGINSGYWPCGILAPYLSVDNLVNSPVDSPVDSQTTERLSATAIHSYQDGLSPKVTGGYFYPEDAQVDNRALMKALRLAVQEAGIEVQTGVTVVGLVQQQGRVTHLRTSAGDRQAAHYVLATGAWSSELLPVPVLPRKGQMLSVRVPVSYGQIQPLRRVLFGEKVYIVPRQDGRIVVGATVEDVGFAPHNTAAGTAQLLNSAIALYPLLQNFPIEELWWGFRPATPDELPILGPGPCDNLTLATGHYRNGVLLAPITAKLTAACVQRHLNQEINQSQSADGSLLAAFSYKRFRRSQAPSTAQPATPAGPSSSSNMQLIDTPLSAFNTDSHQAQDLLTIAGKTFRSRLMTGTGKFSSLETMRQSFAASESEIVTVAVRRVQTNAPGHEGLADAIDWQKIWMLPNTAGCKNAEEAIRVARLGREMAKLLGQEDNNFVKLEVIPDAKYLLPDPIDTLKAAEQLVKEGFAVLPYINADPLLAKRLEEAGCATVMPLGSPIGSGQGIRNAANIEIIIENANIPVVVDAGIGTPSEAAHAMELGADALLVNSAIALAKNPVAMGMAMGMAAKAGRMAYQSGRIPVKVYASASSPTTGTISS